MLYAPMKGYHQDRNSKWHRYFQIHLWHYTHLQRVYKYFRKFSVTPEGDSFLESIPMHAYDGTENSPYLLLFITLCGSNSLHLFLINLEMMILYGSYCTMINILFYFGL